MNMKLSKQQKQAIEKRLDDALAEIHSIFSGVELEAYQDNTIDDCVDNIQQVAQDVFDIYHGEDDDG